MKTIRRLDPRTTRRRPPRSRRSRQTIGAKLFQGVAGLVIAFVCNPAARADVKLPAFFGDHMVLQQDMKVPVWGTAEPGEEITVTAGDHTATTRAGADGKWRVDLAPFPTHADPLTLTIAGHNRLSFSDVLVGEVWIASGQSNMEVPINWMPDAAEVTAQAHDSQLRLFYVVHDPYHATALEPASDLIGQWKVCTPEVADKFSAVAYFFGRELRSNLKRPVGIIGSYVGGTPACSWISLSGLEKNPPFQNYVDRFAQVKADAPAYPGQAAAAQDALNKWTDRYEAAFAAALTQWKADVRNASQGSNPQPALPPPTPPAAMPPLPPNAAGDRHTPTVLYNALIAPLIPFAMRGVIWYQGEDNNWIAAEYRTLFPRLISDWREKWGEGDFPFLFVQVAEYAGYPGGASGNNGPLLREAQAMALALPKTGMATAIDIGDLTNIHPLDKLDVGLRLALAAKHIAYGETLVDSGPVYDRMTIDGNAIRVGFRDIGGGLIIGTAPWTAADLTPIPATDLLGFTLAGEDRRFFPAQARIDGATVVVSSPDVANPVAVRYDWAGITQANLYNREGLPAPPFRSDTWDDVQSPANPPPTRPAPPPAH